MIDSKGCGSANRREASRGHRGGSPRATRTDRTAPLSCAWSTHARRHYFHRRRAPVATPVMAAMDALGSSVPGCPWSRAVPGPGLSLVPGCPWSRAVPGPGDKPSRRRVTFDGAGRCHPTETALSTDRHTARQRWRSGRRPPVPLVGASPVADHAGTGHRSATGGVRCQALLRRPAPRRAPPADWPTGRVAPVNSGQHAQPADRRLTHPPTPVRGRPEERHFVT
jgi:hypothetical protein